jgi:hypothetical protein
VSRPFLLSDYEAAAIVRRYRAGAAISGLAREHDCSYSTVRDCLLREGVTLRPHSPPALIPKDRHDEIRRRYQAGEPPVSIAGDFGVTRQAIQHVLRQKDGLRTRRDAGRLRRKPRPVKPRIYERWELFDAKAWADAYWDPAELPSLATLAGHVGMTSAELHWVFQQLCIPTRSRGEQLQIEYQFGRLVPYQHRARAGALLAKRQAGR